MTQRFIVHGPSGGVALQVPETDVLKEALGYRHEEPFEKSLGRAVRKFGGTYADYVDLIGRVRDRARADKTDLRKAARTLADQA